MNPMGTKTVTKPSLAMMIVAMASIAPINTAYGVTWDMPTAYPNNNYHTQNIKRFAKTVSKVTGGELTIRVRAGGTLFKGNQIKRAVQIGRAFIGERLLSAHANAMPLLSVDSIPFLASSFQESDLLWQAAKPVFNKQLASENLKILYSVAWLPQGFYAQKAIKDIGDFSGLRMRGYNSITNSVAQSLKAKHLQIPFPQLSQALASGKADSFISSAPLGYDIKAWETVSHYHDFQAWMPRNYIFVNLEAWNKLPKQTRDAVEAIALLTERAANLEAENLSNWHMNQFRNNGMTVVTASPELRKALRARAKDMLDTYLSKTGADGQKIINDYYKLKAEEDLE